MYILPAGTAPRTKNKWGMGLGIVRSRMPRSRGVSYFTKKGALGLGQNSPDCPAAVIDPITGELCANLPPIPPAPQQPGVNPSVDQAYKNLLTQQQNSQNPLDYVSPQAAIAAGLDPQTVYNAWSKGMAKFPTQNAALQAGIPAGVVTQLWAASRSSMPATSWLDQSPLGLPNLYLVGGGLALALFAGMRRGRR